ncbi:hypothetical protein, partial [Aeromonas allosaccharophila]
MTCWPKHYPDKCPPEDAYFYDGILYRFTNRNNPSARDFKSFYENLITHDPQPASRADMASEGLPRLHAP